MQFHKAVLPNGMEVIAECRSESLSVAIGFFVRTGARNERAEEAGISHFLEHMAFKGRGELRAEEINRRFDAMGAACNAYTNEESTGYFAVVLPEFQSSALALLNELLQPELRPDDFETERKVILEEIRMYQDEPPYGADDALRAAFFGSHPLGRSVLGSRETIAQMTPEMMRDYHRRRYYPANIILAAAGQVDFDALVDQVGQLSRAWDPADDCPCQQSCLPTHRRILLYKPAANLQYFLRFSAAPPTRHPLRAAARVLAAVVGDEVGSRLFWELVDTGRAESAGLSYFEYSDAGMMAADLSCDPADAVENYQILRRVLRDVQERGVTEHEVEQARNKMLSRIVLSQERPSQRLFALAADWFYERVYRPVPTLLDEIAAVRAATIAELLRLWPLEPAAEAIVGPLSEFPEGEH